ncbi:MAG: hypothetical protein IJ391_05410, partial [Clostridia bacterium]|nr:hypothetical protein [Clostridia bacterium]
MKVKLQRALSLFLVVLMIFTMLPLSVLADETVTDTSADTETTTYPIVLDKDQIKLGTSNLGSPTIAYDANSGVTSLTMTADVTDGDTAFYRIDNLDTVYPKNTPYIVLGVANSTPGTYDVSIGYKNAYHADSDTAYETFRAYGKRFAFSDTITNVLIDATAYTSGDRSYTDSTGASQKLTYSTGITADTTYDYLRIRLRESGTINAGTTIDVRFIAFFDTLEAAQSYVYPVETATVTFAVDGEQYGDAQTYDLGNRLVYPETEPAKEGYIFKGWDVAANTLVTADTTVNAIFEEESTAVDTTHVFLDANKLVLIADAGEVITENNIPILSVPYSAATTSDALVFSPNKEDVGFTATGDGSFYDYSHYVIRYKTTGSARTSDTVNLRGTDATAVEREKYGGTEQVVASDTYTYKTIARDTFTKGSSSTEAPNKNWTAPWITLKMFTTDVTEGAILIDFIAAFKNETAAAEFITAYEAGEYERPADEGTGEEQEPVTPPVTQADYVLLDANELLLAIGKGEVKTEKANDYVPYFRLTSA